MLADTIYVQLSHIDDVDDAEEEANLKFFSQLAHSMAGIRHIVILHQNVTGVAYNSTSLRPLSIMSR